MHKQGSLNCTTTHPNPSLLNQGYTFFPPGSNSHMSNMRGATFGPNTGAISGPWGSYVRMDIRHTAYMDGSDRVSHEIQDGRGDSDPAFQDGMNDNELPPVVPNDDFPPEIDTRERCQSFIPEAPTSSARHGVARPHIRQTSTNGISPHTPLTPPVASHIRSNFNFPTNSLRMFRGASNVRITGDSEATFNTVVDGVVVQSRTYGPGRIDNLEFGMRSL